MREKREKRLAKVGYQHFRVNEKDREMLQFVLDNTSESITDIFRDGLRMKYNLERCKVYEDDVKEKKEPVKEPDYYDFVEDFYEEGEEDEDDF